MIGIGGSKGYDPGSLHLFYKKLDITTARKIKPPIVTPIEAYRTNVHFMPGYVRHMAQYKTMKPSRKRISDVYPNIAQMVDTGESVYARPNSLARVHQLGNNYQNLPNNNQDQSRYRPAA